MEEVKENNTGEVTGPYESMAEAFISQIEAIKRRAEGRTDNLFDCERDILNGISGHMQRVAASLNWFDPAVIRRFYPMMRECAVKLTLERKEARKPDRRRPVRGSELDAIDDDEIPF